MKLFKRPLPPPPAVPEPITVTRIESFFLRDGRNIWLEAPRKMNFMMEEYVVGSKVDQENGMADLTDRTMISTDDYGKSVMMGYAQWQRKYVECPEEPRWSESY